MNRKCRLLANKLLTLILSGAFCLSSFAMDKGQTVFQSYKQSSKIFWAQVYPVGGTTLYCGQAFTRKILPSGGTVNIEHAFPAYWMVQNIGCGSRKKCQQNSELFRRAEADLHNLYPTEKEINEFRGNYLYSLIPGEDRAFGTCDFELDKVKQVVEPREDIRGDLARAIFYMMDTYGFTLEKVKIIENRPVGDKAKAEMLVRLKEWALQDPPDQREIQRNNVIYKIQGIENRFIQQ